MIYMGDDFSRLTPEQYGAVWSEEGDERVSHEEEDRDE